MKRKIQEIGGSYFVSIPKNWIKMRNLDKGSELEIETNDLGQLIMAPEIEKAKLKPIRKTVKYAPNVVDELFRAYFSGASEIAIVSDDALTQEQRTKVREFADSIMSVEVVEEDNKKILLQNYGYELMSLEQSLKRQFQISYSMLEDVLNEKISKQLLESFANREKTVNKFYFMIITHVNRLSVIGAFEDNMSYAKALHFRLAASKIESITDDVFEMAKLFHDAPGKKKRELVPLLDKTAKELIDFYKICFETFFKGEYTKSNEIWATFTDLRTMLDNVSIELTELCSKVRTKKEDKMTFCALHSILYRYGQILRNSKDLADLAF